MTLPAVFSSLLNTAGLTKSKYITSGIFVLPIFYVWFRIRAEVRSGGLDISEDYFITCLYPKGLGDPDSVEKYFLRSGLLVKVSHSGMS